MVSSRRTGLKPGLIIAHYQAAGTYSRLRLCLNIRRVRKMFCNIQIWFELHANYIECFLYTRTSPFIGHRVLVIPILEYMPHKYGIHIRRINWKTQLRGARWVCGSRYNRTTFS